MFKNYIHSKMGQGITAGALFLCLAGFWALAVSDELSILKDSSQRLDEEKLTIRRMEVQLGKLELSNNLYKNNTDEINHFRANFLQQKDERLLKISKFLEQQAREHTIQLDQVAYSTTPSREKDLEIQQITLPLVGRYRDIRAFIADVESSDLFLIISQMTLEGEQDRNGVVELQLTLVTYFQGEAS